jgi:hypothetical protein
MKVIDKNYTWKPIETGPDMERVWVCGWHKPSGRDAGYWWYHEDVIDEGVAIVRPHATHWAPIVLPPFPTPPQRNPQ